MAPRVTPESQPADRPRKNRSEYPLDQSHRRRMRAVFWMFLGGFAIVGLRLVYIQVYPDFPLSDNIGGRDIPIARGCIYDTDGAILARDRLAPSLWANPSKVRDPYQAAEFLQGKLGLDKEEVYERLTRTNADGKKLQFVWVVRWLTEDQYESLGDVGAIGGGGLSVKREYTRTYPEKQLASHVIGFANREQRGCEGIEAKYDRYLFGTAGKQRTRVDAQRRLLESLTVEHIPPTGGADVYLTISKPLQRTLETELAIALEEFKAARAMGMLMDPYTGAILALANAPAFDPNNYNEVDAEARKNRALIDVFEPGSSFKVITAAAALEEGLVRPDTRIDCEMGRFNPYGHTINDVHKLGVVPFSQAFAESSNVGFVKVAALVGPERFADWIATFGFGRPACADVQVESGGIFRPREKWSRLSMGALPIGQEIAVTMPQLLRAYAVFANGGHLVEPYLVDRVVSPDGMVLYRHEFSTRRRILSEETAHMMRDLCHLVVAAEHGTGRYARIEDFRACGKTGTAQIAKPHGGGYYDKKYTAVFAGFAPLADPRICAVIVVQEPKYGRHYGGMVSGPIFKKVVKQALTHLGVPKDPMTEEEPVVAILEPRPVARLAQGGVEEAAVPAPDPSEPAPDPDAGLEYLAALPKPQAKPALNLAPFTPEHEPIEGLERPDEIETLEIVEQSGFPEEAQSGFPEEAPPDDPDTVVARKSIEVLEPSEEESLADLDGLELVAAKTDIPDVSDVGPALPDLRGMTKRQAKEALESLGLRWDVRGSGWVISQDPAAGTPLDDVRLCRLVFDSKRGT